MKILSPTKGLASTISKVAKASLGVCPANKSELSSDVFVKSRQITSISAIKSKIIAALNFDMPLERVFVYDTKTKQILQEKLGDNVSCCVDISKLKNIDPKHTVLYHGHPKMLCEDGSCHNAPISLDDFRILNNTSIHEIVAIDEFGRESKLTKGSSFKKLKPAKVKQLEQGLFKALFSTLDEKTIQTIKNTNDADLAFKKAAEQQNKKTGMKAVDKFWQENSKQYGLIYTSEFEY